MAIELLVVQFWSEIILVIANQTRAARSFDFEITRKISDQIALTQFNCHYEFDDTVSCYQLIITVTISRKSKSFI